jgi:hypothetical protein
MAIPESEQARHCLRNCLIELRKTLGRRKPPACSPANGSKGSISRALGALAYRPVLYRRNAVAWCSVRAWRADAKRLDIARLKLCKRDPDPSVIAAGAAEISEQLRLLFGTLTGWLATSIACGHSRRPDCFGRRLGAAIAEELASPSPKSPRIALSRE